MPSIVTKGPNAVLDFAIDWTLWLKDDTLSAATWIVPDELVRPSSQPATISGGKAVVWLGGGQVGQTYTVTCKIVTAQGRTDERELTVRIARR